MVRKSLAVAFMLLTLVATTYADMVLSNPGPTSASGAAPITWTATDASGDVEVWVQYIPENLPFSPWVLIGTFPASDETTGSTTFDFGADGMKHHVWVGSGGAAVSTVNIAPGTPSITVACPSSGAQPITWSALGARGTAEVWVQPRNEYGSPLAWEYIGTYGVNDGTTAPDTYEFVSGYAYELWVGANGYQLVGDIVPTIP